MSTIPMTLSEFRKQCGTNRYVAIVPDDTTHIQTRPKTLRKRLPPCPHWPDGREVEQYGPEMIEVQTTADGFRVAVFRSKEDFRGLFQGPNGVAWHDLNTDLRIQIANEAKNSAGPIR